MSPLATGIPDAISSENCVDISYGVRLECEPQQDQSISLTLLYGPHRVATQNFPPTPTGAPSAGQLACDVDKLIKSDLTVSVDYFKGEVTGTGGAIETYSPPKADWCTTLAPKNELLMRFAPCAGLIGDVAKVGQNDMSFNHRYGDLRLATPNVLRLYVTDEPRAISNIGQKVRRGLFPAPAYHDFTFNTVAYVGSPGSGNVGRYTDPDSPWFNLFVGYYQIDASTDDGWDRPFGYEPNSTTVRGEDLLRLGKADWNWFSNWNYGTPAVEIEPYDDLKGGRAEHTGASEIGGTWWQSIDMGDVEVASTYESDSASAAKLVLNSRYLTPIWRMLFGSPCPRPNHPKSFIPTTLRGTVYMAFQKGDDGMYRTRIFGGTIEARDGDTEKFLDAQLSALKSLIASRYAALGFKDKPDDPMPKLGVPKDGEVAEPSDLGEVRGPGPIAARSPEETERPEEGDSRTRA
jgi:hypothetical protein